MSILDNTSKRILVQSMRNVMENAVVENAAYLSESQIVGAAEFVHENATYEQLLNVSLNPNRETKYLPAHVLEGAAAIIHAACMTGRKRIGANALAEGAMNLHEKTGAVITESMLDAAYDAVVHGNGLAVIAESLAISENKFTDAMKSAWEKTKSGSKKAWEGTKSGAKWISGIDDYKAFKEAKKDAKTMKERFPTHWSIDKYKKDAKKSLAKGIGKNAATLAALAAAGYGIKKIVDWRKKKKQEKKD